MRDIFNYVVVVFILVCALALDYAETSGRGDIATVALIGICIATVLWAAYSIVGALKDGGTDNE
jgi:bacteriorhodopsin